MVTASSNPQEHGKLPQMRRPRRIAIVGNSGSGKSSLARAAAEQLGCKHIELDAIHHLADWTPIERDQMRAIVTERTQPESWIVDGNYQSMVRDIVFGSADTVVWLNLPRRIVMSRITRRTLGRMVTRKELWNGNRERPANLFKRDPYENIILWAWTQHHPYRSRYREAMQDRAYQHLNWVELKSPREVRDWVASLG